MIILCLTWSPMYILCHVGHMYLLIQIYKSLNFYFCTHKNGKDRFPRKPNLRIIFYVLRKKKKNEPVRMFGVIYIFITVIEFFV